jgi:hypothetical protein
MPGQRGQRGFEFFGYINPSIRLLLQFLTLQQGLLGSLPESALIDEGGITHVTQKKIGTPNFCVKN